MILIWCDINNYFHHCMIYAPINSDLNAQFNVMCCTVVCCGLLCRAVVCCAVLYTQTHMEAARLLQFTEEEFVKTLDWAA